VKRWVLLALAACGDNAQSPPDAAAGCTAAFAGNFAESSTSAANCAAVDSTDPTNVTLGFSIASATLATAFAISIDLGTLPAAGPYNSDTVTGWNALALARVGNGACEYSAGATAIPQGRFTLALDAIDGTGAHGSLALEQWVLTVPGSQCGLVDTEQLALTF
jgi:hypothetical protein